MSKPILALPSSAGLKSRPILVLLPLWGRENLRGTKQGGAGQAGQGKITIPKSHTHTRPIPAPPPLRGGENPRKAKRKEAGQAGQGKIAIPKSHTHSQDLVILYCPLIKKKQ